MAESNDHLSGEISVEASLTELGVKASAKSRFLSAIDRMFGGLFDVPAAFLEGKASQIRLESELRRNAQERRVELELSGEIDLKKLEQGAAYVAREKAIYETINKSSVIVEALADYSEKVDDGHNESDNGIEDDWINVFGGYAEKASSDRLRQLWGKILSGEVRKPGSFSLTTLRVLSELDQQTALLIQKYVKAVMQNDFLVKGEDLRGQELIDLTFLEEVGILQEASGMLGADQKFDGEGNYVMVNGSLALIAKGVPNSSFRLSLIKISRAGREILTILPKEDDRLLLKAVGDVASKADTSSVEIVAITGRPTADSITFNLIEKIK